MDIENPHRWSSDLLSKAGISNALGAHYDSVWHWGHGLRRPNAGHVRGLAQLFKIDLAEAVRRYWNENIGDPCPCGCGGVKVFPRNDRARHLHIEVTCKICGPRSVKEIAAYYEVDESTVRRWFRRSKLRRKRIYSDKTQHRTLCSGCRGHGDKRAAKLATVKCVGFHLYEEKNPRFANACLARGSEVSRLRSELLSHFQFRSDDPLQRPFVDIESERYRCSECSLIPRKTRGLEKYMKNFLGKVGKAIGDLEGNEERRREAREDFYKITSGGSLEPFNPGENMPRIRKESELNERRKQCWKLSYKYKDRSGNTLIFMKNAFEKTERSKGPKSRVPGRKLITFIRKTLRGLCLLCPKAIFSHHEPKMMFHKKCLNDWRREHCDPGYPPLTARKGGQAERENLERILIWLVRYKRRESVGEIAKADVFAKSTVQTEIERARRILPEDEKVPERLQASVSLLRSPARDL